MTANEKVFRPMFEKSCKEGVRPLMYNLKQCANGEYVSPFTENAWKNYWRGINDYFNLFSYLQDKHKRRTK